ncbi:hypothetical protein [Streptomyces abyssalis]|uniref:hypothetical protein n=1 Tax=Streptomyces abyssalis TaxID=933944 RepID=UPI0026D70FFA
MHVQIILFDGFDPLDVIAPYEVLHAAGQAAEGAVTVELVAAEGTREVPSGTPPLSLRAVGAPDLDRADVILLPGAAGRHTPEPEDTGEGGQWGRRRARTAGHDPGAPRPYARNRPARRGRGGAGT